MSLKLISETINFYHKTIHLIVLDQKKEEINYNYHSLIKLPLIINQLDEDSLHRIKVLEDFHKDFTGQTK